MDTVKTMVAAAFALFLIAPAASALACGIGHGMPMMADHEGDMKVVGVVASVRSGLAFVQTLGGPRTILASNGLTDAAAGDRIIMAVDMHNTIVEAYLFHRRGGIRYISSPVLARTEAYDQSAADIQ